MMPPQPPTVNPNSLDFGTLPQDGSKTLPQIISNNSDQPLIWVADNDATSWLRVEPAGTLGPNEKKMVKVKVDTNSLTPGNYSANLTYIFTSEANDMVESVQVEIKLVVYPLIPENPEPPAIVFNVGTLKQGSRQTLEQLQMIHNPDGRTVNWDADTGGANWLIVEPNSGTLDYEQEETVQVTVDTTTLATGTHSTVLSFSSEVAGVRSKSERVLVKLFVQGIEALPGSGQKAPTVFPNPLDFGTLPHNSNETLPLSVSNPNSDPNFVVLQWNVQDLDNRSWLTLDSSGGTLQHYGDSQTIHATVNTSSLATGSYSTVLSFSCVNTIPEGGPTQVNVSLVVS